MIRTALVVAITIYVTCWKLSRQKSKKTLSFLTSRTSTEFEVPLKSRESSLNNLLPREQDEEAAAKPRDTQLHLHMTLKSQRLPPSHDEQSSAGLASTPNCKPLLTFESLKRTHSPLSHPSKMRGIDLQKPSPERILRGKLVRLTA